MTKPASPSPRSFVEKAWGPERAALILDRKRPPIGSEAHLSELRASLAMTDRMTERWVSWVMGTERTMVRWMPRRRRQTH